MRGIHMLALSVLALGMQPSPQARAQAPKAAAARGPVDPDRRDRQRGNLDVSLSPDAAPPNAPL